MPKIRSQGLRVWYQKLLELSSRHDVPTPVREHIAQVSIELPHLDPSEMSLDETTRAFGLKKSDRGYQLWQFRKVEINLPESFLYNLNAFESLTQRAKGTEARLRYKLDTLISAVYQALVTQNMLVNGPTITLAHETTVSWGPIIYKDELYLCIGRANYSLFFGEKDHLACHIVMIEAETVFGDGDAQLLAYMSIIQADRKKRGQPDWTVYGVLSDGETFVFYDLDMNSQYTVVYLQVQREGWQMVANMLGSLIIEGIKTCSSPVRSSLASNPSPRNSRQQISPQLPPLGTLPSIEDMMEMDK